MMYNHTISLGAESSLHSFIIGTDNSATLKALGGVEDQVLMKTFDRKERPLLPMWIKKEIAVYALEPAALEEALSHGWACAQVDHSQDPSPPHPDRLRTFRYRLYCTILSVWILYQDHEEDLLQEQSEAFYALKVWSALVDGLLKTNPDIKLLRGEKCSQSSALRKNKGRDLESRKAIGRRIDGIFMSRSMSMEFGAIETGVRCEGKSGTLDAHKL